MSTNNKRPNNPTPQTPRQKKGNDDGGIGIDWVRRSKDKSPRD